MIKPTRVPIATWFRASCSWNVRVRAVKVVAVTDKTITYLDGSGINDDQPPFRKLRNNISTDDFHFFPTWGEAKDWCIAKAEEKVRQDKAQLARHEGLLANAKGLTQ